VGEGWHEGIGVGDGGGEACASLKFREKYFSCNYYVKFGYFGANIT